MVLRASGQSLARSSGLLQIRHVGFWPLQYTRKVPFPSLDFRYEGTALFDPSTKVAKGTPVAMTMLSRTLSLPWRMAPCTVPYGASAAVKPTSHSTGRDGTCCKDRREATGRSDGVQCEHQEWERNRTTVQIGTRRETLDRSNFSYVDGRRRGRKRTKKESKLSCPFPKGTHDGR